MVGVAWFSIDTFISAKAPTKPTTTSSTASGGDTVDFSTQHDTPVVGAVRVNVTLKDFSIASSVTQFRAGIPYYFVVTNVGPSVHEFTIVWAMPDGKPLAGAGANARQLFEIEQIGPHSMVSMNYKFTPPNVGKFEIDCLMRGHYLAGMRLPIVVTQ
jgi:uncharacterized cupredoxin-like copper-binding protein